MSGGASGTYRRTERPAAPCCGEVGCAHDPAGVPTVPAPRPSPLGEYRAAWAEVGRLLDAEHVARQRASALWDGLSDEDRATARVERIDLV